MIDEIQTYKKSIAMQALKDGSEVYATQILRTSDRAEDCRLWSVDDILNVDKALFIIKEG